MLQHKGLATVQTLPALTTTLQCQFVFTTSVTRFDKVSPLWLILNVFGNFLEALFSIWLIFEPTLENIFAIGQIYIVKYGQILNK